MDSQKDKNVGNHMELGDDYQYQSFRTLALTISYSNVGLKFNNPPKNLYINIEMCVYTRIHMSQSTVKFVVRVLLQHSV